jgi:cytochrome c553
VQCSDCRDPHNAPEAKSPKASAQDASSIFQPGNQRNGPDLRFHRSTSFLNSTQRSFAMTKPIRSQMVLALVISLAGAAGFAQAGDATYKAKCASCHGAAGTPSAGMAKMMGIKAVSDPDIQKLTDAQMAAAIKDGKGKMKPIAGLTDDQIKDVVTYYRGLK